MKMKRTNKFFVILLTLAMIVSMFPMTAFAAEAPWSGSGTQQDPYQISSAEDLKALAETVNDTTEELYDDSYFKLTNDIDLGGQLWTPIGNSLTNGSFEGTFDGDGHYITGLNVSGSEKFAGLFGYTYGGRILNVSVYGSVSTDG